MKKLLVFLLSTMLVLVVFVGCGSSNESSADVSSENSSLEQTSSEDSSSELTVSELEELWGNVQIEIETNE